MHTTDIHLLLADDDFDDCELFKEALDEMQLVTGFNAVPDGEQLMAFLTRDRLPDIIFIDLNMPRKNGLECLLEIKSQEHLSRVPIVVWSTSLDQDMVRVLYNQGATYYIRKPNNFDHLKKVIFKAVSDTLQPASSGILFEHFVLTP